MNSFEQRRADRKVRQEARALRLRAAAGAAFRSAHDAVAMIPPGQPILVGHHSERRHRRDLARHDQRMRKGIALQEAAQQAERAAASESTAISADDPDAADKLRERIAKLQRDQDVMTAANKVYRNAKLTVAGKLARLAVLGISERAARCGLEPDFAGRVGFPGYALSNNSANIRRLKDRLEAIERASTAAPNADVAGDGFVIREGTEDNRLLILFDAIPAKEVRARLKSHGFKWSPTRGAWVRQLNNAARMAARWALQLDVGGNEKCGN